MDRENGRGRRRRFSPQLKLQAIQKARQGGVPISRVCEKYGCAGYLSHPPGFVQ